MSLRRQESEAQPATTPSGRLNELRDRFGALKDAREAQLTEHLRLAYELYDPSEEEQELVRAILVERRVVEFERSVRDELVGMVAEADQLEAEAADAGTRERAAVALRRELETARDTAAELERQRDRLYSAVGIAISEAAPSAEVERLQQKQGALLLAVGEAVARVAALETQLLELGPVESAAELRSRAESLRAEVSRREAELPDLLNAQRISLAHKVAAALDAEKKRSIGTERVKPRTAVDSANVLANDGFVIKTDADGKFLGVELPVSYYSD